MSESLFANHRGLGPHGETTAPDSPDESVTVTQYGLRYPAGTIRWATGTVQFAADGDVLVHEMSLVNPRHNSGYNVDLAGAEKGDHNVTYLCDQLRQNAESVGANSAQYIKGCRIVKRPLVIQLHDDEILELPARSDQPAPTDQG